MKKFKSFRSFHDAKQLPPRHIKGTSLTIPHLAVSIREMVEQSVQPPYDPRLNEYDISTRKDIHNYSESLEVAKSRAHMAGLYRADLLNEGRDFSERAKSRREDPPQPPLFVNKGGEEGLAPGVEQEKSQVASERSESR